MNIRALIQELQETEEQTRIEAKVASDVGTSILETICALANEPGLGGGFLLLGVRRVEATLFDGPAYEVVGVRQPEKLSEDLAAQCRTVFNRQVRVRISAEKVGEHTVLGVQVPEAQPGEKPIYFKRRGLPEGAFRRYGPTDQRCTEDDLQVFYEGRSQSSFDAQAVPDASLDDLDPEAVAEYRKYRQEANPLAAELQYSDEDLLYALNCVCEHGGRRVPTRAGILLFGKLLALRRLFPMVRVDYIRVPGRQWVENPDERFASIDLRGPIMQVARRAEAAVMDDLPVAFSLPEGSLQRTETPPIPRRVLREAIVNALMHRSYREHSPIQIIRYSNRIEILNPGYSLKPQELLGEPRSETRNPVLAAVLHETRFAETKGSGIGVMRRLMKASSLSPPTFDSDRGKNEFTVRLLLHHFLSEEDLAWLAYFEEHNLTPDEKAALVFVREVGAINNAVYRDLNDQETLKASQHLRRLRDLGLLESRGKSTATYYVPTQQLLTAHLSTRADTLPGMAPSLSGMVHPLSGMLESLSGKAEPEIGREALPPDLAETLSHLGRRATPEDVREIILRLCAWRDLSVSDLARLTERTEKHIAESYVTPLVQEGKLIYTIPDMPRHPRQTYRATPPSPHPHE